MKWPIGIAVGMGTAIASLTGDTMVQMLGVLSAPLFGYLAARYAARSQRRGRAVEADSVIVSAAHEIVEVLREELRRVTKLNAELTAQLALCTCDATIIRDSEVTPDAGTTSQ